jgi:hypothetical protein
MYKLTLSLSILLLGVAFNRAVLSAVAPILEIDDETVGYVGTIGERNVLVDLKPHLSIKNLDSISKYCFVYKLFFKNNFLFEFFF